MRPIDADALLDDVIDRYCRNCDKRKGIKNGKWRIVYEIGDVPCRACVFDDAKDDIENAPTVDVPDRKVGEWETKKHPYIEAEVHFCTVCHRSSLLRTPYCAFCGARMKGEDDG